MKAYLNSEMETAKCVIVFLHLCFMRQSPSIISGHDHVGKLVLRKPFRIQFISVYFVIISRPHSSKIDLITSQTSTVIFTACEDSDIHFTPYDYSGIINTLELG